MIELSAPNIGRAEIDRVVDALDRNFVSTYGPLVEEFEDKLASSAGVKEAVALSSGTAALQVALRLVGVSAGDLVVVPDYTFVATANAVRYLGATPLFVGVDTDTLNLSGESLMELLQTEFREGAEGGLCHILTGQRLGAIVPVFALGLPPDLRLLSRVARDFGVPLMFDGAGGLGASAEGGVFAEGLATVVSFNGNKMITTGSGGAILTNDSSIASHARHLATTARVPGTYFHDEVGYNYRMTNLAAAIGLAQLDRFGEFVSAKQTIAAAYREIAEKNGHLGFPVAAYAESSHWMSGLRFADSDGVYLRNKMTEELSRLGIASSTLWQPMSLQPAYDSSSGRAIHFGHRPNPDFGLLALPSSTILSDTQISFVLESVDKLLAS